MSLARIAAKTWNGNILFSALLELTYRCNLDCYFCYNDLGLTGRPLSLQQYLQLLEDLAEMQVMNLTLSGGEPLAHPEFLAIGGRARELGFCTRIKSNGHALRGAMARRVKQEIDPFLVEVSIHGARAETHDRQTRIAGSFERLMANLPELADLGLRLKLNCTVTAWNESEVEGIIGIADRLGLPLQFDPVVTPRDDGDEGPLAIAASSKGILDLFRLQLESVRRKERGERDASVPAIDRESHGGAAPVAVDKHCGAGSSTIAIDPYGTVYPCVQWRRPVGSLHESPIREIWSRSTALDEIRATTTEVKQRLDRLASGARALGHCPGLADLRAGDPTEIYPEAMRRSGLLARANAEASTMSLPVLHGN